MILPFLPLQIEMHLRGLILCMLLHASDVHVRPATKVWLVQDFTNLTSLKKLRLDSCGKLRCHSDLAGTMLKQLRDISLRQCRLGNTGCLDILLGLPSLRVSPLGC